MKIIESEKTYEEENFADISLNEQTIKETEFDTCTFRNIDFTETTLINCIFHNCKFINCRLINTKFKGCNTPIQTTLTFENTKTIGIDWTDLIQENRQLEIHANLSEFSYSHFADFKLEDSKFKDCKLVDSHFELMFIKNVKFPKSNLENTKFIKCKMESVSFKSAISAYLDPTLNTIKKITINLDTAEAILDNQKFILSK